MVMNSDEEETELDRQRANRVRERQLNRIAAGRARQQRMFDTSISKKTKRRHRGAEAAAPARTTRIKELHKQAASAGGHPPVPIKDVRLTKFNFKKNKRAHVSVVTLPVWEHAHVRNRAAYWQRVLPKEGTAFTLNIEEEIIRRWTAGRKGGFAYQAQQAIQAALRRVSRKMGLPIPRFWFAVDVDVAGRLHLHGGIDLPANFRDPFEVALRKVGGKWNEASRGQQLHFQDANEPVGWAEYALRNMERVREMLRGGSVTGCTQILKAAARKLYDADRALLGAAAPP